MKLICTCFFLFLLTPFAVPAQEYHFMPYKHAHSVTPAGLAKTTVLNAAEEFYDIRHLKFDIAMNNTSSDITGNVTTTAVSVVPLLTEYMFELDEVLIIDSVKINNVVHPFVTAGDLRIVNLLTPVPQNAAFTAQVFYHGHAPVGTTFFTSGIIKTTSGGNPIVFSLSDRFLAKDWWPCKQSLLDKIDSVDMWVTIPAETRVGSNGLLTHITPMGGGFNRYEWKTTYPIEYYLISIAIAPYSDYSYYVHYTASTDSTLVQSYIMDSAAFMAQHKPKLDSVGLVMDHFSQLFGRYPFWKEKYGHCMAPLSGGMEHQTMSTIGVQTMPIFAHELGHQWWGDHVTYRTWRDIWLSEGVATYCEHLFMEKYWGAAAAATWRSNTFNHVMTGAGGTLIVDDTTLDSRVFDGRLTYSKGGAVAHMLRYMAPDDATYFNALKQFQQQYAFGVAGTEDLKLKLEQVYNRVLDTFFTQWVYGEGYPTYHVKWAHYEGRVYLQVKQTPSKPAVTPGFYMPLEIRLQSPSGDTLVKFYNSDTVQYVQFDWSKPMSGLTVDPDNHIIDKPGTVINDPALSVEDAALSYLSVYPNPADRAWVADHVPAGTGLILYDITGRPLWQGTSAGGKTTIPASGLPAGVYTLRADHNGRVQNRKLLRR